MKWIKQLLLLPFKALGALMILLIRGYQVMLSPILPAACRYTPTCSQYGLEAIKKYGPFKGGYLAARRILRCSPWGGHGHDPVP